MTTDLPNDHGDLLMIPTKLTAKLGQSHHNLLYDHNNYNCNEQAQVWL